MKEIKTDIYKELAKNRANVRFYVAGATLIAIVAIVVVYLVNLRNNKYIYGFSEDKNLTPLKLIPLREIEETYKKGAVEYFIFTFYTIDQYNYESQIKKALWLISEEGERLYRSYQQQGHYNMLIGSSSAQYVENVDIVFDNTNTNFKAEVVIVISKPNQKDPKRSLLTVEGTLKEVTPNYPKNPYGYIIYKYREVSKTEIKTE